jgi:hypothetical protein
MDRTKTAVGEIREMRNSNGWNYTVSETLIEGWQVGCNKTGELNGLSVKQITELLGGIEPKTGKNTSDAEKVAFEWDVEINGLYCNIWSYKGSEQSNRFSTFCMGAIGNAVFGKAHK